MRLSVAMCTYQGERFLGQQLDSLAAQTRLPDELVAHDDRSSDGTVALLDGFARRAPFPVRITVNDERLGVVGNFGAAIAGCTGDVILLADQDDVWRPPKLERLAAALAGERRPGLAFSDAELIDGSSSPVGRGAWQAVGFTAAERASVAGEWALPTLVHRQRHYGGTVTGATLAFRAELRDLVLPMPAWMREPGAVIIHDAWIALLAAAVAPVALVDEKLVGYRQHSDQAAGLPPVDRTPPSTTVRGVREVVRLRGAEGGKADELRWTAALLDRLRTWDGPEAARAVSFLEVRVDHLRARVDLPPGRLRRVPPVLRELVAGRYRTYSSGLRSAGRDLFR